MQKKSYILITGVSSGIGHHLAKHYLNKGIHVIGTIRKKEDAVDLHAFENFYSIVFDVTDTDKLPWFNESIKSILGNEKLWALINNAGIVKAGPLECISDKDFQAMMEVNVMAVRRITNVGLTYMQEGSRIINMSSVSGLFNSPFSGTYCISKHALESMTDVYRRELMPFGIKVIAIEPGPIKTPIWNKSKGTLNQYFNSRYGEILQSADKIIENAENNALDVTYVSKACDKALFHKSPATRYIVHKNGFVFKLFAWLVPDKLADKLVAKTLKGGEKHRII